MPDRKLFYSILLAIGSLLALCIPNLAFAQGKNPFYVEIITPNHNYVLQTQLM